MKLDIRELQQKFGLTAVDVTHDQEEALGASDRIVVMDRGRIVHVGTPEDLYERPASVFTVSYIGDANLITGELRAGQFEGAGFKLGASGQMAGLRCRSDPSASLSPPAARRESRAPLIWEAAWNMLSALATRHYSIIPSGRNALVVTRPIIEPRFAPGDHVGISVDPSGITRLD